MENVIYITCHLIMISCCLVLCGVGLSFKLDGYRAKKPLVNKVKAKIPAREFEAPALKPALKLLMQPSIAFVKDWPLCETLRRDRAFYA